MMPNLQNQNRSAFGWILLAYTLLVWVFFGQGDAKFESLHLLLDTSNGLLSLLLAFFFMAEQNSITSRVRTFLVIGFSAAAFTEILHALVGIEWTGSLSWIETSSKSLRPATWPPSTYALPDHQRPQNQQGCLSRSLYTQNSRIEILRQQVCHGIKKGGRDDQSGHEPAGRQFRLMPL